MSADGDKDDLDVWLEEHSREPGTALDAPLPPRVEASAPSVEASPPPAEASEPEDEELDIVESEWEPPPEVAEAWAGVLASFEASLINAGKKQGGLGQYRAGAKVALKWIVEKGFTPKDVTLAQVPPLVTFVKTVKKPPVSYVYAKAAEGLVAEAVAMQSRPAQTVKPKVESPKKVHAAPTEQREEMANPPEEQYDDQPEEQQDEQQDEQSPGEVQKARRVAARQQPQQVYVMAPAPRAPRQQAPRPPVGRSPEVAKVLGQGTRMIRINKRGPRGQKIYIDDVPITDIGGSIARYLKEYIEPEQTPDGSGVSTYEVYEIDPVTNHEKGVPSVFTIAAAGQPDPNDQFTQVRQAMDIMAQIREEEEARKGQGSEVLKAAQTKAANSGDTNSLILMMLMEKMMGNNQNGGSESVALKLLEGMKRNQGPSFDMPHYPPPPPMQMMPPPPPPPSELAPIVNTLLSAAVTRPEPKPEKSFMEQMKELMAFKELLSPPAVAGPSAELMMLRSEMAAMRAQMTAPKAAEGGIEGAMTSFTKLSEIVKTIAPQINAGGITGALQGILTPKLQAAVGDMLAGGIMGARAAAQQNAPPAQLAAGKPVQPQQPRPPPPAVVPLIIALQKAPDEPTQLVASMEVLQGYYADPGFAPIMDPALQQLIGGNREPAVKLVLQVLQGHRPQLATLAFANKVIDTLIASATGQPAPGPAQAEPPKPLATPTPTVTLEEAKLPAEAPSADAGIAQFVPPAVIPDVEPEKPVVASPAPEVVAAPPAPPVEAKPEVPAAPVAASVPAAQQTIDVAPTNGKEKPTFAAGTPVDPKDMPHTVPVLVEPDAATA
jgi:hypothetical protein